MATRFFQEHRVPAHAPAQSDQLRLWLLTRHVRLSKTMAPDVFEYSEKAATALKLGRPIEIYQAADSENTANLSCADTVL